MSVTVPSPQGRAFGYADEVSAVRHALVDPDRCGCLVVGAAGIGRTTVMNRALDHLESDTTVHRLRGSELLRDRGLGVLEILLSQAGAHREIAPGAALSTLARAFAAASEDTVPIVQLDNSNLIDTTSLAVLCRLADARRIRLVAGAESIRPPVDLLAKLWLGGSLVRIDLTGLDESAIAALVESAGAPTRSAAELLRDTGGNPRLLNQVIFGADQSSAHERILWNVPSGLRPVLEVVAMVGEVPYDSLALLCSPGEIDALADIGLVVMERGPGAGVHLAEPVIAETLKAHVMPSHSLRLFRLLADVVDLDDLEGRALFGYLRWGLSLGVGQPEDRIFAAVGDANAEGRYSDAADLIVASGWETDRVLLELVRADKGRGGIAEAEQTFARLLADADEDADPQYLSRLLCMDYRLTDPNAPEELRVEWVRDLLSTPADTGRVDVTRARFALRGGRLDEARCLASEVFHDHECLNRHRLRACAILGLVLVLEGRVVDGIRCIDQAELMFSLPGLTSYELEDAAPQIFVSRYLSGDWSGARRSVREARSGDRMFELAGALVDLRTGHPARAQSTLQAVLEPAQETDLIDLTGVGRAAKRYADALLGRPSDPDRLREATWDEERADRYSWWAEAEARLFDLQALALAHPAEAADRLHALGTSIAEHGAAAMAAFAFIEAARLGQGSAGHSLAALGGEIDGAIGRLARTVVEGVLVGDADALIEAARASLEFGSYLTSSDFAKLAQKRAVEVGDRSAVKEARILIGNSTRTVRSGATGSRFHTVLSDFERKLVDGVMAGASSHELGELHHLSARTIEWHLSRIYRRLQVANRRELRELVSTWGRVHV